MNNTFIQSETEETLYEEFYSHLNLLEVKEELETPNTYLNHLISEFMKQK